MGVQTNATQVVTIARNRLMELAKISSKATYHKFIRDLERFGYMRYLPSFNSYYGSRILLPS
jgi:hypothetical protein